MLDTKIKKPSDVTLEDALTTDISARESEIEWARSVIDSASSEQIKRVREQITNGPCTGNFREDFYGI